MDNSTSARKKRDATAVPPRKLEAIKPWTFRVLAKDLDKFETVCVTGNCNELGRWEYNKVIVLNKEIDSDYWSKTIDVPANCDILYRYCICVLTYSPNEVLVRRWETHLKPRKIVDNETVPLEKSETFGHAEGGVKIDKGWLSAGTLVQFKFYDKPFDFHNYFYQDGTLSVKITPVDHKFNCDSQLIGSDLSGAKAAENVITEVATLTNNNSKFKPQNEFGEIYKSNEFLMFEVSAPPPNDQLTYVLDFFQHQRDEFNNEVVVHIAYSYIIPDELETTERHFKIPIVCKNKHRPMGVINGDFLVVRPIKESLCTMKTSFSSYWSNSWNGLDVGHRGLGASFKEEHNIVRENTIASLKIAGTSGADMVEFDVQLSKDLVPVIYHDFDVCVALKKKKNKKQTELLQLPLNYLTFEQLQTLKIYHLGEEQENERFNDEDLVDHQPFPLLSDVMQKIDKNVGFNVEIKWPIMSEDGELPLKHSFDMNLYVDKIIEVILRYAGDRNIVFSCFHPEICTMVRSKQNIYPVMFLTQGVTKKWPKAFDPRCNTIEAAVNNALNSSLLGIVVHTEDLLRDSSQLKLATDAGLIIFCWGEENNNKETIRLMKEMGIHGVIFDRLDKYSAKTVNKSLFLIEDKEATLKNVKECS